MEYTRLGRTDVKISRIGLGTWQFSPAWGVLSYEQAKPMIAKAVELGINFFDTAMAYGWGLSENFLSKALRELGVKRDEVVISTKIPGEFLNPDDVFRAVDKSLKIMGFDYIDVLLVHWPPCWHHYPTKAYAKALERLVVLGKVRYLGLSDFPPELIDSFRSSLSRTDVEVLQIRFNLIERWAEEELIPYAEKYGMTVQAWSPIARGALTGKYTPENLPRFEDLRATDPLFHPKNFVQIWRVVEALKSIGEKYGKTPVQVALNWLIMYSPVIVPIPGAKKPEHVEDVVGAVGWRLSYDDWRYLDELSRSIRISYAVYYLEYTPI